VETLARESCRADLLYPCPGFSQLFFSFLTFLLLFAQWGGAIYNDGALTVEYGNFTGNSARQVIVPSLAIFLPGVRALTLTLATYRIRIASALLRIASAPGQLLRHCSNCQGVS
jgi:hypothetical protein